MFAITETDKGSTVITDTYGISVFKMYTQVKSKTDPNLRDDFERTRLHYSVRFGNLQETYQLLKYGADVNVIDAFGNTPLSLACVDKPNLDIIKLLLQCKADINLERPGSIDLLLECVLNCNSTLQVNIINMLIQYGKNVNLTDKLLGNKSCMHVVALTGYVPLAEFLIRMGAIVNIRDNFNNTPMDVARNHEKFEMLRLLQAYINRNRSI